MSTEPSIAEQALEHLVREAMGSGAQFFCQEASYGRLDLDGNMLDVFRDQPATFLGIRTDLADAVLRPTVSADDRTAGIDTIVAAWLGLFGEKARGWPPAVVAQTAQASGPLIDALIAEGWHR